MLVRLANIHIQISKYVKRVDNIQELINKNDIIQITI